MKNQFKNNLFFQVLNRSTKLSLVIIMVIFNTQVFSQVPVKLFLRSPYGYTQQAYLIGDFNNWTYGMPEYQMDGPDNRGLFTITVDFEPNIDINYIYDVLSGPMLSDPFNTQDPNSDYPSYLEITNPMITYLLPQNSNQFALTPGDSIWALFAFQDGQPIIENTISLKINGDPVDNAAQYYDATTKEFVYYHGNLPQGEYTIELSASSSAGDVTKTVTINRAPPIILKNQIEMYFSDEITLYGVVTDPDINSFIILLNDSVINVNVNNNEFRVPVILQEGTNTITIAPSTSYTIVKEISYMPLNTPKLTIDATVTSNLEVTLTASVANLGSEILNYEWTQIYGPQTVSFSTINDLSTQITFQPGDGAYHFKITATDNSGNEYIAGQLIRVADGVATKITRFDPSPWMEKMIIYEINPRSFSSQGTLSDITSGLSELVDLGVNTIYLMPIFNSNEYGGYWTIDYYEIRDIFGTKSDLQALVNEAHAHGIKVILDLSINHTSTLNPFFKEPLDIGEDSPFNDFYIWDGNPALNNYSYSLSYSIPDVNYNNQLAVDYMLWLAEYWIKEFDIDGFRGDVAWGIYNRNPEFWTTFRQHVKNIKPDVFMVSESFPPYSQVFNDGFDAVFDFNLRGFGYEDENIMTLLFQGESNLNELDDVIRFDYPEAGLPVRFADLHDFDRAVMTYGLEKAKLFYSLIFCSRGIPFIWSGSEYGSDLGAFNYTPYERNDEFGLRDYLKKLIQIRKQYINNYSRMDRISNTNNSLVYSTAIQTDEDYIIAVHNFYNNTISGTLDLSSLNLNYSENIIMNNLLNNTQQTLSISELQTVPYTVSGYNSLIFHIEGEASQSINSFKNNVNIDIYPNPTSGLFTVVGDNINSISVIDLTGKIIFQKETNTNIVVFDLNQYSKAVYILKIKTETGIVVKKIVLI